MGFHHGGLASENPSPPARSFVELFDVAFNLWDDVLFASGFYTGAGDGSGGGSNDFLATSYVRAPRNRSVVESPLDASADDAGFTPGQRVQAKWSSTSCTWKDATVVRILREGNLQLLFDGYDDATFIPLERIRKLQGETTMPKPPGFPAPLSLRLPPSQAEVKAVRTLTLMKIEPS